MTTLHMVFLLLIHLTFSGSKRALNVSRGVSLPVGSQVSWEMPSPIFFGRPGYSTHVLLLNAQRVLLEKASSWWTSGTKKSLSPASWDIRCSASPSMKHSSSLNGFSGVGRSFEINESSSFAFWASSLAFFKIKPSLSFCRDSANALYLSTSSDFPHEHSMKHKKFNYICNFNVI